MRLQINKLASYRDLNTMKKVESDIASIWAQTLAKELKLPITTDFGTNMYNFDMLAIKKGDAYITSLANFSIDKVKENYKKFKKASKLS